MTPEALYVLLKQKNNLLQVRNKVSGTIMPNISGIDYSENIIPLLSEEEIKEITSEIKTIEKYREHIRTQLSTIIGKY